MISRTAGHPSLHRRLVLIVVATVAAVAALLTMPFSASAAVGVPVTYLDHAYASTVTRPSEDKPQSKLWYHDGSWWALMVVAGGTEVHIHELNASTHAWRDTGAVVDTRLNSTGDALWSSRDNKLYVASRADASDLQVTRFTYGTGRTWTRDAGFPVGLPTGGSESASIDQDSLGRYWVTYTRQSQVWLAHSNTDGSWTTGIKPNVPDTTIAADDLSALIAFGTSIGVMWSDQQSGAFRFAIHNDADPDTVWRVEDATAGLNSVDDHINLKQLVGDPDGRIFAAVKTSANDAPGAAPTDPLVGVLSRTGPSNGTGSWKFATAGTVADDHTRPIIMIDSTNKELYFLATSPGNGGDIVYKKSPLANVSFPTGRGAPFVDAAPVVNNASGSKDPVTAQSRLVILAVAEGQKRYVHAEMELAGGAVSTAPTVTTTDPAAGAIGVAVNANVRATFSKAVKGVNATTFTLKNTTTNDPVSATVSYNATTRVATLNPAADLAAGVQYTATLTGGTTAIRDSANTPLTPNPMAWSFTTASGSTDTVRPTVTARSPAANATRVSRTANVTAAFSEPVQNVTKTTFTLKNASGQIITAAVKFNSTANKWVLNPGVTLAPTATYTVTIVGGPNGVKDSAGNPLQVDATWTFTTRA